MPRLFYPVGENHKIVAAHLGEYHSWREHRFDFFHQRQEQHFALTLFQHAGSVLQGFTGDSHQRRGLLTRDGLFQ
ncbi:hypothetical protein D3C80_1751280 [compost metagenome]